MVRLGEVTLAVVCLAALASAIPVSLLQEMKDSQAGHSNKVKRAQEVLMFGNQQNRAVNNYGTPRTEKRDIGDNSLGDDGSSTLPELLAQAEDEDYDNNHIARLHHNQQGSSLGYGDLALYRMVDARRKRDAHKPALQPTKNSYRAKREYDLSPEELMTLMRLLEKERRQGVSPRLHQQRTGWPMYGPDSDDVEFLGEGPDENEIDTDPEDYHRNGGGVWMDGPVQPSVQEEYWPKKYKRFMVSKRRTDADGAYPAYEYPLPQRRFFI